MAISAHKINPVNFRDTPLQSQVVRVVVLHVLRHPQDNGTGEALVVVQVDISDNIYEGRNIPQHDQTVRNDIGDSKVQRLQWVVVDDILEDHDRLGTQVSIAQRSPRRKFYRLQKTAADKKHPMGWMYNMQIGTHHTPRQTAGQQREPEEQNEARLPRNPTSAVTEAIGIQPRLLDRVDDHHAQRRADAGDPVNELDMDLGAISRAVGKGGSVDEEEESERELKQ